MPGPPKVLRARRSREQPSKGVSSVLEQSLRELFQQQTEGEPPPGRVTVAEVIRLGRLRRRRLIAAVGTPAFAAAAVLAIAIGSSSLPLGARPQPTTQASA